MSTEVVEKLSNVFGTSRDVPKSYVQRPDVDGRFLNDITRDKHIVVHGSSKSGKTCLRRFHLQEADCVVIQCTRDTTKASLYEMLLKHAGIKCEVSEATTIRGGRKMHVSIKASGGLPIVIKGEASGGVESVKEDQQTVETADFEIDPDDANDVIRVLKTAGFNKFVVIEDFHYLEEGVQQSLAFDLKVFHEISKYIFIVVGVWLESNRLTMYNGDLNGRVTTINSDVWNDAQLRDVIEAGESLLNIQFPESVVVKIVEGCQGNVGLLQEICYRLCEKYDVWQTRTTYSEIGGDQDVTDILRKISEDQDSRYRNFLARFAEGLGETQLQMYKWIAYAVVTATHDELKAGLRAATIFQRVKGKHPSATTLQHANVHQALDRVASVQHKHKLQPVILDYSNNRLCVVDAGFLVYLQTHSKEELLDAIAVE